MTDILLSVQVPNTPLHRARPPAPASLEIRRDADTGRVWLAALDSDGQELLVPLPARETIPALQAEASRMYWIPAAAWSGPAAGAIPPLPPVTDDELAALDATLAGYEDLGSAVAALSRQVGERCSLVLWEGLRRGRLSRPILSHHLHALQGPPTYSVAELLALLRHVMTSEHQQWWWRDDADCLIEPHLASLSAHLDALDEPLRTMLHFALVRHGALPSSSLAADQRRRVARAVVRSTDPGRDGLRGAVLPPEAWREEILAVALEPRSPSPYPPTLFPFLLGADPDVVVELLCRDREPAEQVLATLDDHPADLEPALEARARRWIGAGRTRAGLGEVLVALALARRRAAPWPAELDPLLTALCRADLSRSTMMRARAEALLRALPPARLRSLLLEPPPTPQPTDRWAFVQLDPSLPVIDAYVAALPEGDGADPAQPWSLGRDRGFVDALVGLGPQVVPALSVRLQAGASAQTRQIIAGALAGVGSAEARAALARLRDDPDPVVQAQVAEGLAATPPWLSAPTPHETRAQLEGVVLQQRFPGWSATPDLGVPVDEALVRIVAREALSHLRAHDDQWTTWLVWLASHLPDHRGAPLLAAFLCAAPLEAWLSGLLSTLSTRVPRTGPPPSFAGAVAAALCRLLESTDPPQQALLLRWLGCGVTTSRSVPPNPAPTHGPPGCAQALPLLVSKLRHPGETIPRACLDGLRFAGPAAADALLDGLRSEEAQVRRRCAQLLRRIAPALTEPPLAEALRHHPDPELARTLRSVRLLHTDDPHQLERALAVGPIPPLPAGTPTVRWLDGGALSAAATAAILDWLSQPPTPWTGVFDDAGMRAVAARLHPEDRAALRAILPAEATAVLGATEDWLELMVLGGRRLAALAKWGGYHLFLYDHGRALHALADPGNSYDRRQEIEERLSRIDLSGDRDDPPVAQISAFLRALEPLSYAAFDDERARPWRDAPPLTEVPSDRARQLAGVGADLEDHSRYPLEDALDLILAAADLGRLRYFETRHNIVFEGVVFHGGVIMASPACERIALLWLLNNQ